MRYAIIESGGKQYRVAEGETIDVDRLPDGEGTQIELQRVLLMTDGAEVVIGTPVAAGIQVKATVVNHIAGRKVTHFRYSPKKRIRVRGGHRQQYTRLLVDFVGRKGESRKVEESARTQGPAIPAEIERAKSPRKESPQKTKKKPATQRASTPGKASGTSTGRKSGK